MWLYGPSARQQDALLPIVVDENSHTICSCITHTKETSFGLETSPFHFHKSCSLCYIL